MKSTVLCGLLALSMGATIQDKLTLTAEATTSTQGSQLASGTLSIGQKLTSPDGNSELVMQINGLLAVVHKGQTTWSAGYTGYLTAVATTGKGSLSISYSSPLSGGLPQTNYYSVKWDYHDGSILEIRNDGNLVLFNSTTLAVLWSSKPPGQLSAGDTLASGEILLSPNGQTELAMQTDGNLVIYKNGNFVWDIPTPTLTPGSYAKMQSDGNFVVYNPSGSYGVWATGTNFGSPASLQLQDNTNLVVSTGFIDGLCQNLPLWSSFYGRVLSFPARMTSQAGMPWGTGQSFSAVLQPGQILSPGTFLASTYGVTILAMQTDGNLVLYENWNFVWNIPGPYYPGAYATVTAEGNFVVKYGTNVLWQSGTNGNPGACVIVYPGKFDIETAYLGVIWNMH